MARAGVLSIQSHGHELTVQFMKSVEPFEKAIWEEVFNLAASLHFALLALNEAEKKK